LHEYRNGLPAAPSREDGQSDCGQHSGARDVPEQICQHMRQFWTPVMQKSLRQIAAETPDSLCLDVHSALENL
jgi:hypothetical protein